MTSQALVRGGRETGLEPSSWDIINTPPLPQRRVAGPGVFGFPFGHFVRSGFSLCKFWGPACEGIIKLFYLLLQLELTCASIVLVIAPRGRGFPPFFYFPVMSPVFLYHALDILEDFLRKMIYQQGSWSGLLLLSEEEIHRQIAFESNWVDGVLLRQRHIGDIPLGRGQGG